MAIPSIVSTLFFVYIYQISYYRFLFFLHFFCVLFLFIRGLSSTLILSFCFLPFYNLEFFHIISHCVCDDPCKYIHTHALYWFLWIDILSTKQENIRITVTKINDDGVNNNYNSNNCMEKKNAANDSGYRTITIGCRWNVVRITIIIIRLEFCLRPVCRMIMGIHASLNQWNRAKQILVDFMQLPDAWIWNFARLYLALVFVCPYYTFCVYE